MSFFRLIALAGLASSLVGAVNAADLPEEPIVVPAEEPAPVETSGFYLRGDIGYVVKSSHKGEWDFYNIFPGAEGIDDTLSLDRLDTGNGFSLGVGAGYRFNDTFRMDATLDYFKVDATSDARCYFLVRLDANHNMVDPVGGHCQTPGASSASIWNPMVNAFADLPTIGALTPYIGVGIGAARVDYDSIAYAEECGGCGPGFAPYAGTAGGFATWRLAGAAMVGVSYDLTANAKLDLGYKYTRVARGDAWGYDAQDTAFGAVGAQVRDHGFDFHKIRAGVRYEFN